MGRRVHGADRVGVERRRVERIGRVGDAGGLGVRRQRLQWRDGVRGGPPGGARLPAPESGSVLGPAPEGGLELRRRGGRVLRVRLSTGEGEETGQEAGAEARGAARATGRVGFPVAGGGWQREQEIIPLFLFFFLSSF
ncbi:hypothetical protein EUGRSUZ_H01664 [Eucalyptus grandis]|uniref:Uncharacterized protein n=2 Tax=Eucalyptus grandis TaxID=71139 RepID=A0ACC3JQ44_EUCGR|nr:hypothetical protein EUGRSUZ_H01664 [Eucalyptus grandis]